jgi:hypothetical protein
MRNADVIRGKPAEHRLGKLSIACPWRLPMRAEDLEALREDMLAVITAGAFALRDTIGKNEISFLLR